MRFPPMTATLRTDWLLAMCQLLIAGVVVLLPEAAWWLPGDRASVGPPVLVTILARPAGGRERSECHITKSGLAVTPIVTYEKSPVPERPAPGAHPNRRRDVRMATRYESLISTSVGQLLAKNLGLPNPVALERYEEGAPLV